MLTAIFQQLPETVETYRPVVGGDINQSYYVKTTQNEYILKVHPHMHRGFFQAEIDGLKGLKQAVRVPQVVASGQTELAGWLLLEWIEPGSGAAFQLGQELAKLHQITHTSFGFETDNYIGILPQSNTWQADWVTFFIQQRLKPQVQFAHERHVWHAGREAKFQKLIQTIENEWAHDQTPSLLHGDLWSGNTMYNQNGQPVFLDPAAFYGDRELDIAMSQLFGGFTEEFLQGYQTAYPLTEGWQQRLPTYQLYYALAHLNMFGESYGTLVDTLLEG